MNHELNFEAARFYGTDLTDADGKRLRGALKRVWAVVGDGQWRTNDAVGTLAKCPAASAHRHISTLRTQFGVKTDKKKVGPGQWVYAVIGVSAPARTRRKMKPIGDPALWGNVMRFIYAKAFSKTEGDLMDNAAALSRSLEEWADDMEQRVKKAVRRDQGPPDWMTPEEYEELRTISAAYDFHD